MRLGRGFVIFEELGFKPMLADALLEELQADTDETVRWTPLCDVYVCPGCRVMSRGLRDLRTRCTCVAK
jgi:hypothetical protein